MLALNSFIGWRPRPEIPLPDAIFGEDGDQFSVTHGGRVQILQPNANPGVLTYTE